MSRSVALPDHVVFRELPFCGVLLDLRRSAVYRLSQEAAAVLRQALADGAAEGPYEPVIRCRALAPGSSQGRALLAKLHSQGLVLISADGPGGAGGDDGR